MIEEQRIKRLEAKMEKVTGILDVMCNTNKIFAETMQTINIILDKLVSSFDTTPKYSRFHKDMPMAIGSALGKFEKTDGKGIINWVFNIDADDGMMERFSSLKDEVKV